MPKKDPAPAHPPRFASFDAAATGDAKPVTGWYDLAYGPYDGLPPSWVEVTDEQWEAHLDNPSGWTVTGGVLTAPEA